MLLTEKVKLVPTSEEKSILLETMEIFNEACDKISAYAFSEKAFDIYSLHKIVYHEIRSEFHLPAQLTIRAIAKVVESYKLDKSAIHLFRKRGCLIYDSRILAIKSEDTLSLTTLSGRLNIKIQSRMPLIHRSSFRNQMDLIYVRGSFYLNLVYEVPEAPELDPQGFLGVDIGIANLAAISDGELMSGESSRKVRRRYKQIRGKLQRVGTKSAKKHLKKISRKESANKAHQNHCISKAIVLAAKGTNRAIAIEDLKGIRSVETVSKRHREERDHWAFYQLQTFIQYKAKIAGVPVFFCRLTRYLHDLL